MQTKILVLKRRQLLLAAIAAAVVILLVILLCNAFRGKEKAPPKNAETMQGTYIPGSYETELALGGYRMRLSVLVDSDRIKNAKLSYIDKSIETMYPLLPGSLANLNEQFVEGVPLTSIRLSEDCRYTESYLLEHIAEVLSLAALPSE